MEALTWTGNLAVLNPILGLAFIALLACTAATIIAGFFVTTGGAGNVATVARTPADVAAVALNWSLLAVVAVLVMLC